MRQVEQIDMRLEAKGGTGMGTSGKGLAIIRMRQHHKRILPGIQNRTLPASTDRRIAPACSPIWKPQASMTGRRGWQSGDPVRVSRLSLQSRDDEQS
ncbi:hypothetical protein AGR4A_pAt10118 [Agrobacterium tumefaciens str. B6]|uniref:Uncharacterized protein n=1 Tax=Agrobacterium tumefaciens str. B6 TaxID=1183423 RepID=A0A822VBK5_AGRTU|nr:hypothetical protein AGR4A_pAt10118 [Agrobacterium tumefaciens str. B6]